MIYIAINYFLQKSYDLVVYCLAIKHMYCKQNNGRKSGIPQILFDEDEDN